MKIIHRWKLFTGLVVLMAFAALPHTSASDNVPVMAADIVTGTTSSSPHYLTPYAGELYFLQSLGTFRYLWKYNNDTGIATQVSPISFQSETLRLIVYDGALYFSGEFSGDNALWKFDAGTGLATQVSEVFHSQLVDFAIYDGDLYFGAWDEDQIVGFELWRYDADSDGVSLVEDLYPGSNGSSPEHMTVYNGELYFQANDGLYGAELWKYNSSTDEATRAANISEFLSSYPQELFVWNGMLYFSADDGSGFEPWQYSSVTGEASRVVDLNSGTDSSYPVDFTVLRGNLYFSAEGDSGRKIYKLGADGGTPTPVTASGTPPTRPGRIVFLDGALYIDDDSFSVYDPYPGVWQQISDIDPLNIGSGSNMFALFDDSLFFAARDDDHGIELWKYTSIPDGPLENTSFEEGDLSPSGWMIHSNSGDSEWECGLGNVFGGVCANLLTGPTRSIEAIYTDYVNSGPAGEKFGVRGAIRGLNVADDAPAALGVIVYRTDGSRKRYWVNIPKGDSEWQELGVEFTTKLPYDRIRVGVLVRPQGGEVWVDDLMLVTP